MSGCAELLQKEKSLLFQVYTLFHCLLAAVVSLGTYCLRTKHPLSFFVWLTCFPSPHFSVVRSFTVTLTCPFGWLCLPFPLPPSPLSIWLDRFSRRAFDRDGSHGEAFYVECHHAHRHGEQRMRYDPNHAQVPTLLRLYYEVLVPGYCHLF